MLVDVAVHATAHPKPDTGPTIFENVQGLPLLSPAGSVLPRLPTCSTFGPPNPYLPAPPVTGRPIYHAANRAECKKEPRTGRSGMLPNRYRGAGGGGTITQQQKRQLATENAALLKRAIDAEKMVHRLKEQHARFVDTLTAAHQPIAFPQRRT